MVRVGVAVMVGVGVDVAATACTAANALRIPEPESRSTPAASISSVVEVKTVRICAVVSEGLADFTRAAIAPACGAAAEVPQNGSKPGVEVCTQSAAVMSGFWRTAPPVDEKFPGVMAVPLAK